jgi:hypothetical protein
MWLLLPKDTDIRDSKALSGEDMVEVPAGSGRLYTSKWVDDCGKGFTNEHRFSVIFGLPPWGVPFPGPPIPPPPPLPSLPAWIAEPYPFISDTFSFAADGNSVDVIFWTTGPLGSVPTLTSSTMGTLTTGLTRSFVEGSTGIAGQVYYYRYRPLPGPETLTLASNDPDSASAWYISANFSTLNTDSTWDDHQNASSSIAGTIVNTSGSTDLFSAVFLGYEAGPSIAFPASPWTALSPAIVPLIYDQLGNPWTLLGIATPTAVPGSQAFSMAITGGTLDWIGVGQSFH